jgi:hypothetical protein
MASPLRIGWQYGIKLGTKHGIPGGAFSGFGSGQAYVLAVVCMKTAGKGDSAMYEKIIDLKILTDTGVDTSSIESIVRDATRGAVTDEAKVLALFNWYRRAIYHHRNSSADRCRRDVLRAINSFGFNLCGSQSAVMVAILQNAGFKTRVVCGSAEGDFGGHTFWEIFYDSRWHCFDTMTSLHVYTRDNPPHIAGLDELKADPTLVTKAVAEKRAPPGYLYCTFHQELKAVDKDELVKTMGKADLTWSTFLFKAGMLVDFWAQAPQAVKMLDEHGPYGGRYNPDAMSYTLKRGETFARRWDNQGKWLKSISHPDFGPHHICGSADEHDPVNFKYYEPYLKENYGHTKKCYRWYGNGWYEWRPETAGDVAADAKIEGLTIDGGLFVVAPGRKGSITFQVKEPYAAVEDGIELKIGDKSGKFLVRATILANGEDVGTESVVAEAGQRGVKLAILHKDDRALFEYELRLEFESQDGARVSFLPAGIKTTFMENIYALPGLVPGRNVITVSAASPVKLRESKLVVQYDWEEGDGWKVERSVARELKELPASFEIEVAGPKMPRMKQLVVKLVSGE